jgi:hypothetical protein
MEKRKQAVPVPAPQSSAMDQKKKNDSFKMETIKEDDSGEFVDAEYLKTREVIGGLINEYDSQYDDSMGAGLVQSKSAGSVSRKNVQDIPNESIDHGDDEEDSDSDKNEIKITKLCESVLVAGKRAGQQCERKCREGFNTCVNHGGK